RQLAFQIHQIRIAFNFRHTLAQSRAPNFRIETVLNRRGPTMETAAAVAEMIGAFAGNVAAWFTGASGKSTTGRHGHYKCSSLNLEPEPLRSFKQSRRQDVSNRNWSKIFAIHCRSLFSRWPTSKKAHRDGFHHC